jgi:hypothetical protein
MNTLSKLGAAVSLIGLALTLACCSDEPERKVENAADVGDTVAIEYPASTIMCTSRDDASNVYVSGEIALRQTRRLERSVQSAIEAEEAARKYTMRSAYTCQWAPRDTRYNVVDKKITGTEDDAFHVVEYCLHPVDGKTDTCWWIAKTYGWYSPFEHVERPQAVAQNAQAR